MDGCLPGLAIPLRARILDVGDVGVLQFRGLQFRDVNPASERGDCISAASASLGPLSRRDPVASVAAPSERNSDLIKHGRASDATWQRSEDELIDSLADQGGIGQGLG